MSHDNCKILPTGFVNYMFCNKRQKPQIFQPSDLLQYAVSGRPSKKTKA